MRKEFPLLCDMMRRNKMTVWYMMVVGIFLLLLGSCTFSLGAESYNLPPHEDLAKTARYIVHKADWCTLTTISSNETMLGQPFSVPTSISDGFVNKSSGIPYFYHAKLGTIYIDVLENSKVTLSFSEAQFGLQECLVTKETDPEWPLCARLSLIGNMNILTGPAEISMAKTALFTRHPAMTSWHSAHQFVFMKLEITRVLLLDYFGGWKQVSVKDYFNVKQ